LKLLPNLVPKVVISLSNSPNSPDWSLFYEQAEELKMHVLFNQFIRSYEVSS